MRSSLRIAAGVAGAVAGFVATFATFALLDLGNRADPITSGLVALFVYSPIGAIAGLVLATKLAMRSGSENAGSLARNSLKTLGVVVLLCVAGIGAYLAYAYATATPWLNRNGGTPLLIFEVRLPAGVAVPQAERIKVELETDLNTMPGEVKPGLFHRDGDKFVIAGEVELAFRTRYRQVAVTIEGQPERTYPIDLSARAPHTAAFGPWQRLDDGSEIRYRAKWPGKD